MGTNRNTVKAQLGQLEMSMSQDKQGEVLMLIQLGDNINLIVIKKEQRSTYADMFDLAARALETWVAAP